MQSILDRILLSVGNEAPPWTSDHASQDRASYNFHRSEQLARSDLTPFSSADIRRTASAYALEKLAVESMYPKQALLGWFLSTICNVLPTEEQNKLILDVSKKCFVAGANPRATELFFCAFVDGLEKKPRSLALQCCSEQVEGILTSGKPLDHVFPLLKLVDANQLGAYNLTCAKRDLASQILGMVSAEKLVAPFKEHFANWQVLSLFTSFLKITSSDERDGLALQIYRQAGGAKLVDVLNNYFGASEQGFAISFSGQFISALPKEEKRTVAATILNSWSDEKLGLTLTGGSFAAYETMTRIFINAFPADLGESLVRRFAKFALSLNVNEYDFLAYRATNDGWSVVSDDLLPAYIEEASAYLKTKHNAEPAEKRDAILKVAALMRGILQGTETQEVDFHPTIRPKSIKDGIAVHIKPNSDQAGAVIFDFFKGDVRDFDQQITAPLHPHVGSRYLPPAEREVFPREKCGDLLTAIKKVEAETLRRGFGDPKLPTLQQAIDAKLKNTM